MHGKNGILKEAERLHGLGLACHWLHPRSKAPIGRGWGDGPRKTLEELTQTYRPDNNLGVRLGRPSFIAEHYLAVIDVDVKGVDEKYRDEAVAAADALLAGVVAPTVASGRGGGSRHYYILTRGPVAPRKVAVSSERVRVMMPSVTKFSKVERETLTPEELSAGWRIRPAWEVAIMGQGQQVVLPPSVHPDSGKRYEWTRPLVKVSDLPVVEMGTQDAAGDKGASPRLEDFAISPIELSWSGVSEEVKAAIIDGTGVIDRSGYLLRACSALVSDGMTQNEVLTILTDPRYYLSSCAYEHAETKSRKRAAEWLYKYTLKKVIAERTPPEAFSGAEVKPPRVLSEEEAVAQAAEIGWEVGIIRTKEGTPQKLLRNVFLILSNSTQPDIIKRDEFCYRDSYSGDTPWGGKKGELVNDGDVDEAQLWFGKKYGFEPQKTLIESAFVITARQNSYDPVRDFLEGLPAWDGTARLDTWLRDHFHAEGNREYLAQVFRKWMVAMVMRVYQPGSKFDWMPIFEGAQGVGKSSFGNILVGDKYFIDWLPNLSDKDAALSLQGMWGIELGELSQFRRNELESIKAFITRTIDKIRPPYGRRMIESPRRCVFFGTTNRKNYLIDETGNRRFKPVEVGELDFEALRRDRLQLFAEAKHLWLNKVETERSLELTGSAREAEVEIHREKMVEDDSHSMEESMRKFLDRIDGKTLTKDEKAPVFNLDKFKIIDLFEGTGPLGGWRKENRNLQFAGKMLRRLGFTVKKSGGLKTWKRDENRADTGGKGAEGRVLRYNTSPPQMEC